MASFSVEMPMWRANPMAWSGSSSFPAPAPAAAAFQPTTDLMNNKEACEQQLLRQELVQLQDVALDTQLEAMKVGFHVGNILRRQYMERCWMEIGITWERTLIAATSSPSAPYSNGLPPICRGTLRGEGLAMTRSFDRAMAVQPVNLHLLGALLKIGPDGFRSEQLKCKWAPQLDELSSNAAESSMMMTAVRKRACPEERLPLEGENSELLDEDEDDDDGMLCDVKRLDKEILSSIRDKVYWRRGSKESYKWYYPLAELSSREEHLTRLAERLTKRAEGRGMVLPTESEVIGCMLLDLLITSAMSPSVSAAAFPSP